MIKKTKIRDIRVYAFSDKESFLFFIKDKFKILIAMNAEKILKEDPKLHQIINNNIAYPDGVGTVMALRKKGIEAVKIPGAEFWLDIVGRFYKEKKFYLAGATEDVIQKTVIKLKSEYPEINIVGYRNGFLEKGDKSLLVKELKEKKPNIVFIAQGSPRQEYLMNELIKEHPALYMGLGGSFDVFCGLKQRAPNFFLNSNLEWLYRLIKEPTRFKRQFVLIKFFILLHLGKLS